MIRQQRTVSIGYVREDGDFRLLATLSNIDEEYDNTIFDNMVNNLRDCLDSYRADNPYSTDKIIVLERQDADDYVNLELEELEALGIDTTNL